MAIGVGDKFPSGAFVKMNAEGPAPITTEEFFGGKKVVLFGVPGAFTPPCSEKHLPGFVEKAAQIKTKGVDIIACLSVNDVFVMTAWGKDQNVGDSIEMLADGSAVLIEELGTVLDLTDRGLGVRSSRYSMIVDDGVVTTINLEDGGAYEVSGADTILSQL